jgi:2-oxoglutarate ferredoxin oxidoreductase subunit alpha
VIDRGAIVRQVSSNEEKGAAGNYRRFKLSENPISPRVVLGTKGAIFWNTGDEHTEEGHITEDPEIRIKMMEKRMSKLDLALKEIPNEDKAVSYGEGKVALISWGSTKGAILDAMERLIKEGLQFKLIQVRLMNPFPDELVSSLIADCSTLVDIEMNYSGQLGALVTQKTGRKMDYHIVKYNGRPMSLDEVYYAVKRILSGDAPRRQVLTSGT